jgi:hypothetical protein
MFYIDRSNPNSNVRPDRKFIKSLRCHTLLTKNQSQHSYVIIRVNLTSINVRGVTTTEHNRMSLNDLSKMIFDSDLELVMMEASGAELGCTTLGFLYIWYLIFCHR